jgi:hypothetical protein
MRVTDAVILLSCALRDAGLQFSDYMAETGSYYFSVGNLQIRVSNHSGHSLSRSNFSVRTDAQTKTKDRIYNAMDISLLVKKISLIIESRMK